MVKPSISSGIGLLAIFLISVSGCIASETDQVLTFSGKIQYIDLEGGFFGFTTEDGKQYLLLDLPEEYKKDGLQVQVSGVIDTDVMTIQMWGEPLRIQSIKLISEKSPENSSSKGIWNEGKIQDITPEQQLSMTTTLLRSSMVLGQTLVRIDDEIKSVALDLKGKNLQNTNLTQYFEKVTKIHPSIYEVTVLDRKGTIIAAYPDKYQSGIGTDTSSQALVSAVMKNPVPGMSELIDTIEGERAVCIIYPVFSSSHSLTGYLSTLIHPDELIRNEIETGNNVSDLQILLFQPDGTYLGGSGTDGTEQILGKDADPLTTQAGYGMISTSSNDSGVEKMAYWNTITFHNVPWRIIVQEI